MVNRNFEEIPIEKLRWRCNPNLLPFETTEQIEPCEEIIGQERALEAIRVGLDIGSIGYNIFVTGLTGQVVLRRSNVSWKRWISRERFPTISVTSITSKTRTCPI